MAINTPFLTWNLQEIVAEICLKHPEISQVYLFGSRAYKTHSFRSDIDLLAITDGVPIPDALINVWLHEQYPPVDLFCSYDSLVAKSVTNGSMIQYQKDNQWGYANLVEQLDAKLLWDNNGFSNDFSDWIQQTLNGVNFQMSVIPSYAIPDFTKTVGMALQSLEASGIKPYYSGSSWTEISKSIIKLIEDGLRKPSKFARRARSFSFDSIKIRNEYDFQNLIQFLLKPLYPDISPEPFMVEIDGNSKNADFALIGNKIVIEAKWVDDTSKKDTVVKTISGLSNFYTQNPNIRSLIFLVLYKKGNVNIDANALDYTFSYEKCAPPIYVRFIESDYTE